MGNLELVILITATLISSTISGFLGMAGGIALLGVMTAVLPAAWVIPLHGVVQLGSNFTRTLAFIRHVRWKIFLVFAVPVTLGMYFAQMAYSGVKLTWFKPGIGVFILIFLAWRRYAPKLRNPPLWIYAPLGLVVGFLALFVGATGPFQAPFFLRDDFKKENVIATKAVCQTYTHFLKLPVFLLALDFDFSPHYELLAILILCVILGTLTGKKLLTKISKDNFVRIFEYVLVCIAIYLIVRT